jgi:hypothetical protein
MLYFWRKTSIIAHTLQPLERSTIILTFRGDGDVGNVCLRGIFDVGIFGAVLGERFPSSREFFL